MTVTAIEIKPDEVFRRILQGDKLQIVDVRESNEYAEVHLADSISSPLSVLSHNYRFIQNDRDTYLICQSGKRARVAAQYLDSMGVKNTFVIQGGLELWEKSGLPLERSASHVWSLDRQVRFTAGSLILVGIGLSYLVNSNWIFISAFVALGMIMSAVSNSCAMATILKTMPWNLGSSLCNTPD